MSGWLALVVVLFVRYRRPFGCPSRKWAPYEDETGFGYAEWRCQYRFGHAGKHAGWLR